MMVMDDVDGARYTVFFFSSSLCALLSSLFLFSVVSSLPCLCFFFFPNGFGGSAERVVDGRNWGFDEVMLGQVLWAEGLFN